MVHTFSQIGFSGEKLVCVMVVEFTSAECWCGSREEVVQAGSGVGVPQREHTCDLQEGISAEQGQEAMGGWEGVGGEEMEVLGGDSLYRFGRKEKE